MILSKDCVHVYPSNSVGGTPNRALHRGGVRMAACLGAARDRRDDGNGTAATACAAANSESLEVSLARAGAALQ